VNKWGADNVLGDVVAVVILVVGVAVVILVDVVAVVIAAGAQKENEEWEAEMIIFLDEEMATLMSDSSFSWSDNNLPVG